MLLVLCKLLIRLPDPGSRTLVQVLQILEDALLLADLRPEPLLLFLLPVLLLKLDEALLLFFGRLLRLLLGLALLLLRPQDLCGALGAQEFSL